MKEINQILIVLKELAKKEASAVTETNFKPVNVSSDLYNPNVIANPLTGRKKYHKI